MGKFGLAGTINCMQEKWQTRKIEEDEEEAGRLRKAAGRKNTRPIWDYRRKLRTAANARNIAMKKKDVPDFQRMGETVERWGEWTSECRRNEEPPIRPKIEHIRDVEWGTRTYKYRKTS